MHYRVISNMVSHLEVFQMVDGGWIDLVSYVKCFRSEDLSTGFGFLEEY